MSAFTQIDLSQLPPPEIIEQVSYETILNEMVTDLQTRDSTFDALVESDPAFKILEVAAYREFLLRQQFNERARGALIAYARSGDLENLAAFFGVERLVIDPGDPDAVPPIEPTYETDENLRRRAQLALEGFSTAGPQGAYIFHALSVAGVKDVSVVSPVPGDVEVTVLSTDGDGTPAPELVAAVDSVLGAEDTRPLTDKVTVQAASVANYTVEAILYILAGPDPAVVIAAAQEAVRAYVDSVHKVGAEVRTPAADIINDTSEAAFCTTINLTGA